MTAIHVSPPIKHHFQIMIQYSGHDSVQPSLATFLSCFSLLLDTEVPGLFGLRSLLEQCL